jgi:hypothetical protein
MIIGWSHNFFVSRISPNFFVSRKIHQQKLLENEHDGILRKLGQNIAKNSRHFALKSVMTTQIMIDEQ